MPGTTPNLLLPYPTDTDPIDVAGDMQELAEAIDLWGNVIDDEWLRQRNEKATKWSHPGGSTLYMGVTNIGQTSLGPFAYPVNVSVVGLASVGYAGAGVGLACSITPHDGSPASSNGKEYAKSGFYINQPLVQAWDVVAGQQAGWSTEVNWADAETTGIGIYFQSSGYYRIQRTGP